MHRTARSFTPPTDVIELEERLVIVVEIAGVRPTDLTITLHDRLLIITGRRERPALHGPAYHQVEIGYGEFRVEIALPWPVEREQVSASYESGFLEVSLPRKAPRTIRVLDGSTS